MVARIARLRIALLSASFRGPLRHVGRRVIALAAGLLLLVAIAWMPVRVAQGDPNLLAELDVVTTSALFTGVLLVAFFAPHRVLDPRLFGQYPTTSTAITVGLLVTTPLTWAGFATIVWGVAFVSLRSDTGVDLSRAWAIVMLLAILPVGARIMAHLTELTLRRPVARTTQRVLGALTAIALVPMLLYVAITMTPSETREMIAEMARALTWSPPGALVAYVHAMPVHLPVVWAGVALALGVGILVVQTRWLLTSTHRPSPGPLMRAPAGWFDTLPLNPTMAIAARCLTYWIRDPRYRVSLAAIPVIPLLVLLVMLVVGLSTQTLAVILLPLTFILVGWMIHNDVATDSSAFWIHVASGVRGWQDRIGRVVPVFLFGLPLLLISSSVAVIVLEDWRVFPGIFALGFVALASGAAVSSVVSVAAPYPTTRPHESPFVQPLWYRSGAGFAQTISMVASALIVLPAFLVIEQHIRQPIASEQLALLGLGLGYGVLVLGGGVAVGGWIFDRRSSEILAFTQVFD